MSSDNRPSVLAFLAAREIVRSVLGGRPVSSDVGIRAGTPLRFCETTARRISAARVVARRMIDNIYRYDAIISYTIAAVPRRKGEDDVWDHSFIVPCALMMITLVVFYFSRSRLPVRLNSIFLTLIVVQLLVLATDIVSTNMDEHYELFLPSALYVANTAFFVLYLLRIYCFHDFVLGLLNLSAKDSLALRLASVAPFGLSVFACASSFVTGWVFSIQADGYHSGPLYVVLAIAYFYYTILNVLLLLKCRNKARDRDLRAAVAFNLVLLAGAVVRLLLPRVLVMDTFCMVSMTIIYLAFLNPDLYLTKNGAAFNARGFRTLLDEPSRQRNYFVLGFALCNYSQGRSFLGGRQMDDVVEAICRHVSATFPRATTFYLRGGRFALVGEEGADWDAMRAALLERFAQVWQVGEASIRLDVAFAVADSATNDETASVIADNLPIALDNVGFETVPTTLRDDTRPINVTQVNHQLSVMRSLEYAIEHDAVEAFFQPIYDGELRTIVGAEALARIRDANGQVISPGEFIPLAERSGQIHELGKQVLERTCAFIQANDIEKMGLRWINVNVSPIQCIEQNLAVQFDDVLRQYRVPAESIHLELTEQSIVDYSVLQEQIVALESEGFRFVLDDYGSGYSNLTRVRQYPFVTIKIDMEVVWDYYRERDSLLPTIMQGFRQMGLSITAEGIESEEMAQALTDIGSDYLQGYYFSKPLSPEEFVARYGKSA